MDVEFSGRMGGIGGWNLMLERLPLTWQAQSRRGMVQIQQ